MSWAETFPTRQTRGRIGSVGFPTRHKVNRVGRYYLQIRSDRSIQRDQKLDRIASRSRCAAVDQGAGRLGYTIEPGSDSTCGHYCAHPKLQTQTRGALRFFSAMGVICIDHRRVGSSRLAVNLHLSDVLVPDRPWLGYRPSILEVIENLQSICILQHRHLCRKK